MAEGARLESVYTRKRIEGSNPSLTAKFKNKVLTKVGAFFLVTPPPSLSRLSPIKVVPYGAKRLIG